MKLKSKALLRSDTTSTLLMTFLHAFVSAFSYWKTFDPQHYKRDPWKADYEALKGDWETVGLGLTRAMKRFEYEYADELAEARQQQRLFDPDKNA